MWREDDPNSMLDRAAWTELREIVARFRAAVLRGERPAIEAFLPGDPSLRAAVLTELVHEDLELRVEAGERPDPATYLARFPELAADRELVGELAAAESRWLRRTRRGEPDAGGVRGAKSAAEPGARASMSPPRIGRYELGDVIGRGACGVVHRAVDTTLRRTVALKRPRPGAIETADAVERFLRESRAAASLRHPNIVRIHDAGLADGELYLVSELIEGRDLAAELAERRPAFRRSAQWVAALAGALAHAHALGVIHRDVKPSNVLIDAEDRVHLTDFGLAKSDGGGSTLTAEGHVIGTPAYMAPEQTQGNRRPVDARTDVYSLGVILYELLTGSRPLAGAGPMLLARIREEEPRPPRRLDQAIPRDLETICLKAMAKEPRRRYVTAGELEADVNRWLRGEPVQARPVGRAGRFWLACRRRPVISGLAASLAVAITAGLIGIAAQWRRAEHERSRAETALEQAKHTLATLNALNSTRVWPALQSGPDRDGLRAALLDHYRAAFPHMRNDPMLVPELATEACQVATLLEQEGSAEEARSVWREADALIGDVLRENPDSIASRFWWANCLMRQAVILRESGRGDEARALFAQARERWQAVRLRARQRLSTPVSDPSLSLVLADCECHMAQNEVALGRADLAAVGFRQSCAIAERLVQSGQLVPDASRIFAVSWGTLVRLDPAERSDQGLAHTRSAQRILDELVRTSTDPSLVFIVAAGEDVVNRADAALCHFRRAVELLEQPSLVLCDRDRWILATCYHVIGRLHVENNRPAEAVEPYRKAIAIRQAIRPTTEQAWTLDDDRAGSWHRLGEALEMLGRPREALEAHRKAIAYRLPLITADPAGSRYRTVLDEQFSAAGRVARSMGRAAEAAWAARGRRDLWPESSAAALRAAGELARAAFLFGPDESLADIWRNEARRGYALEALASWREAARIAGQPTPVAVTKTSASR